MTGLLKDIMNEQAEAAQAPVVDVDAVIRAGDKRVRRRRVAGGAGVVAAVAAIAVAVPAVQNATDTNGSDGTTTVQPAGAFAVRQATWATGSTIHYGPQTTLDVAPLVVHAFVQTDDGFVFTTKDGTVYFVGGTDTEPVEIGATTETYGRLTADDSGSYVGWVDYAAQPLPELVVYDTAAMEEVVRTSQGVTERMTGTTSDSDAVFVYAIDGETVYWRDGSGAVARDLGTRETTSLEPGASAFWMGDVANGSLARMAFDDQSLVVSPDPRAKGPTVPGDDHADLSPEASYVATDPEDTQSVYDVGTGREVTPRSPDYVFTALIQWVDDDSYIALGIGKGNQQDDPVDLLRCSVPNGTCVTEVAEAGTFGDVQFPVGESLLDD